MPISFKSLAAKPCFQANKEPADSGKYILSKKATTTYCNANKCPSTSVTPSENNLYLLKNAQLINRNKNKFNFSKNDLNMNLFTALDLSNVAVVADLSNNIYPVIINPTFAENLYANYVIDPNGVILGNSTCGVDNYMKYLTCNHK